MRIVRKASGKVRLRSMGTENKTIMHVWGLTAREYDMEVNSLLRVALQDVSSRRRCCRCDLPGCVTWGLAPRDHVIVFNESWNEAMSLKHPYR